MARTKRLLQIVLLFVLAPVAWAAETADGNLIVNPGLESADTAGWRGASAAVERIKTEPHSGGWCLRVKDESDDHGQGNSPTFKAPPGRYYVEAWLRIDPRFAKAAAEASPFIDFIPGAGAGTVTVSLIFDVPFFGEGDAYLGLQEVGKTGSTEWTRLSGIVTVPDGAATVSLRVLPTGPTPGLPADAIGPLHGAVFVDDFYFAPLAQAIAAGRAAAPGPKRSAAGPILADESLVLHYTFEFPDTTGMPREQRIVRDRSLYGNDGKIVNHPEALEELDGRRGVLRFGGQTSYIDCGDSDSLYIGGDMSFEMWGRLTGLVRSKGNFAFIFGDADSSNFNFGVQNWEFLRLWYTGSSGSMLIPTGDVLDLQWSHIAFVVEYPRCRIYRDGKLVRDAYMPVPGIARNRKVRKYLAGRPEEGSGCPIDLDEFRVYSRALTAGEIRAHALGESVPPGRENEIAVDTHWYEETVSVRLSCKGSNYGDHVAEMVLLKGDYTNAVAPKKVPLQESYEGSKRHVATAVFPLSDLVGQSLDAVARIQGPDGKPVTRLTRHVSLARPDWVHTGEGYSEDVPPPWTAVEAREKPDGTVEVGVWGRRQVFGPAPFLRQIETAGAKILSSPMTLKGRVDGKPIARKDGSFALKDTSKTAALLEQTLDGGPR